MGPARTIPSPADPEQPRDEPDAARHALARELVADDPEGEREDGPSDALDRAGEDQDRERRREGREQRSPGKPREHDEERPLLAEHVAHAAGDRRRHRGGEEVRREDPRDAGRARVELLLQRRQGRHDEGLQHGVAASGQREDREHNAGAGRRT